MHDPLEGKALTRRIEFLKKRASYHYETYVRRTAKFDCGLNLAAFLTGAGVNAASYNEAMRELAVRDPRCPSWQPLPEGGKPAPAAHA